MSKPILPEDHVEIQIPFCGFYNSQLDDMIDREIEQAFDVEGNGNGKIPESFWRGNHYDHSIVARAVSEMYLKAFEWWINQEYNLSIKLTYSIMTSPKEYNFETDRLFAVISHDDLKAIIKTAFLEFGDDCIAKKAEERFTSRSGFISFYSPDINEWPKDVSQWDHNQLGTILECFPVPEAYELMEDDSCNGHLSNAVYEGFSPAMKGIVTKRYNKARKANKV